jgi:hypothetical protein
MSAIDELHDADFFTPEQVVELARAGRIYAARPSLADEQSAYPYFVLTGNAFDLSVPRLCWHINASGQKDMATRQSPCPESFGALYELDFAPAALRQDLMDYAHRRSFMMLFGWQDMQLRGDGQTQQEARLDAVNRLRTGVAAGCLKVSPEALQDIERALLDAHALLLDRRMLGRFTKPWPDVALVGEGGQAAPVNHSPAPAQEASAIAGPAKRVEPAVPVVSAGPSPAPARVPRSVRYAHMRQRA